MPENRVKIINADNTKIVGINPLTSSLKIMQTIDDESHLGNGYTFSHFFPKLADQATAAISIRNHSATTLCLIFNVAAGGDAVTLVQASPTLSASGTCVVPINRNRICGLTSGVSVYVSPTVTSYSGVTLSSLYVGGIREEKYEWILNSGVTYVFAIRNTGGAARNVGIQLSWYERD